jgi:hypothetical protein
MSAIIGARPHRRFALFGVVLASLLADGAVADPYDALPKTVVADVKALEKSCVDDGGMPAWKADELVKTVDLSPDGVPDYVIATEAMDCGHHAGRRPWTSSGGAQVIVWVSVGRRRWSKVFDDDAFLWDVSMQKGRRTFSVLQNIGYCGNRVKRTEYRRCAHAYVWQGGRLRQVRETGSSD